MSGAGLEEATIRVGRNSAWLLTGEVIGRTLGAVYQVLLARYLGVLVFGEYSFALTLAVILGILADMGLYTLVTREVSRRRDRPFLVLKGALLARGLLAVSLGLLAVLAVSATGRPARVVGILAILAAGQLVQGQGELLAAAHRGRERMRLPVLVSLFCRVGLVATGIAGMAFGASVQVLAGLVAVWALPLLLLALSLPRPRGDPERAERAIDLLRRAAPIGIGAVLWTVYFRADLLLVSFLKGDAEAGIFAAPFRLVEAGLLLAGPVISAAFPLLSSRSPKDPAFREVFCSVVRTLALLGAPLAVFLAIEARPLLDLLLGPAYSPGAPALLLLAGVIPISFAAAPFLATLVARDQERVYVKIMGAGVVVNFLLAFALIPRLGATGAAAAMLVTELAVLTLTLLSTDLNDELRPALGIHVRAILAAITAGGALLALRYLGTPLVLRGPIAFLLLYPALAVLAKVLRPARILLFLRALKGRE